MITFITTGGPIGALAYKDPRNPPEESSFSPDGCDVVGNLLNRGWHGLQDQEVISFPPRDSKNITTNYFLGLLRSIASACNDRIIITYGTDRILQAAALLQNSQAARNKRIILTGAMTPLLNGSDSDGFQNLAFATDHMKQSPLNKGNIGIVLSDYHNPHGLWLPRFYPFAPGQWEKFHHPMRADRSRLVKMGEAAHELHLILASQQQPARASLSLA